jgi:hypothetical protein
MRQDDALLTQLRGMWSTVDPAPGDLAERVLFTVQLEDLEVELMRLHEASDLVGARGGEPVGQRDTETPTTVTFSSESLTVMLTIASDGAGLRRIDGWLAPAAPLRIDLRRWDGSSQHTVADDDGRFSFDDVPVGLVQLRIEPTQGAGVSLARPVVTPAVQI